MDSGWENFLSFRRGIDAGADFLHFLGEYDGLARLIFFLSMHLVVLYEVRAGARSGSS